MTHSSVQAQLATENGGALAPEPRRLLVRVMQSTFWMFSSSLFIRALNLLRGVILARLLFPADFGLFGLASVIIGFSAMFNDVGAGVFLIYRQDKVEDHADTAFWTNLAMATLLAGGVAAVSPLVGRIYGRPDVVPVLVVLAGSLWLQTATTVHRNLLRRDLRFRALAVIDALVNITSFAVAILLAWRGYGVWAFVLPNLLGNVLNALLFLYVQGWWPKWHFSRPSLAALAPFSGWYVGQALVWYFVLNIDNLLVGKYLGMEMLGLYGLAYNYALLPVTVVAGPLGNVTFAELARLHPQPSQFWSAYFRLSRLLAGTAIPIAVALSVAAPDLFPVVFGPRWNSAILPFQTLAIYGAVRCLWVDPFAALGRFDWSFWLGSAASLVSLVAIYLGLRSGIAGVAGAVLLVGGATQVGALYIAGGSRTRLVEGLRKTLRYLLVAGIAAGLALLVRQFCQSWFREQKLFLASITILTVFVVYATVFRKDLRDLLLLAIESRKQQPDAASLTAG